MLRNGLLGMLLTALGIVGCNAWETSSDNENMKSPVRTKKPYLLMATSMDCRISSTPLLDIDKETIKRFNDSPFDGIALNIIDIYSAQKPPEEKLVMDKAAEFKAVTQKAIWPRINFNRLYQRSEKHPCNKANPSENDIQGIRPQGMATTEAQKLSTYAFKKINIIDIYDDAGALSDFYTLWGLALKFSKNMQSGIALDFEDYSQNRIQNKTGLAYDVSIIAKAHGKPVDEVVKRLVAIGARMAEMAEKEYPEVVIIAFFLNFQQLHYEGDKTYHEAFDYVAQGMLMKAKARNIPLLLVEGGESSIHYVNRTLEGQENRIADRQRLYGPWVERFPKNFEVGATITLWDDVSRLTGWPKSNAGDPNPFQSLADFTPFLRKLFKNYNYVWFYQPMCTDYVPFDPNAEKGTRDFHEKLDKVIKNALKDN